MSSRPASWAGSWRAALRISRREVLKHKARNTLIVLMLALPVFGASAIDTVVHSYNLTTAEKLNRDLGTASALVMLEQPGQPIYQTPDGSQTSAPSSNLAPPSGWNSAAAASGAGAIAAVLPSATIVPVSDIGGRFGTGSGELEIYGVQTGVDSPLVRGMYDLESGRFPTDDREIAFIPQAAAALGISIGQKVTLAHTTTVFTVTGIAIEPNDTDASMFFALPGAVGPDEADEWLVSMPGGVDWSAVEQLNKSGFTVESREVMADPPSPADNPYYSSSQGTTVNSTDTTIRITTAGVLIGMILLEIVLLAGPAFAVSTRSRRLEFAMLAAAGADRAQLRRVVLADGVVLGLLGGVLGAALGSAAAAGVLPFAAGIAHQLPGAFRIAPAQIGAIALLAAAVGLAAAYVPARTVMNQSVTAALTGRADAPRKPWRAPLIGVPVIVLGLLATAFGARNSRTAGLGPVAIDLGVAAVEVGTILCTSAIIGLVAGAARWLPLGPRLALRDAARHRGRTTPAVAAMFAAVAGAIAISTFLTSVDAQARADYIPQLRPGQVATSLSALVQPNADSAPTSLGNVPAATVVKRLDAVFPISSSVTVISADQGCNGPFAACSEINLELPAQPCPAAQCLDQGPSPIYSSSAYGSPIGGAHELQALLGVTDPAAAAMLRSGGAVVFDKDYLHDGTATFSYSVTKAQVGSAAPVSGPNRTLSVPAVYTELPAGDPGVAYMLSDSAAQRMGAGQNGGFLIMSAPRGVTGAQEQQADRVLGSLDIQDLLTVERGYHSYAGLIDLSVLAAALLVAVGAAAIATGLALADGRRDLETLSAVGGAPLTRRLLSGSTALVITVIGSVIGVAIGLLPPLALIESTDNLRSVLRVGPYDSALALKVPWPAIGIALIALPLATALGAALVTRSRIQLSRRLT